MERTGAMNGEFFDGVKQWEFDWGGNKAKLPVFYYDNTTINAIYTASSSKVRPLLGHPDMRLVELYPGRCMVVFTAFEYRRSDIDPYNEVAISFPIAFGTRTIPGLTAVLQMLKRSVSAFVWQLPVTTEIARYGGVELYGYPKFIADIDFVRDNATIRCDLAEGGEKILSLEGKVLPTHRGNVVRFVSYSVLDGIPLVANICQNPIEIAQTRDKSAARLELGTSHPIAETLRGVGLSRSPIAYVYSPVNQAILFAGRNLMDR